MAKVISAQELLKSETSDEIISKLSFEEGMKLLEELVAQVEQGSLSLERSVLSYERGVALVKALKAKLEGAAQKLKLLKASGEVEEIDV